MTPFEVYKDYLALKNHFTKDSYDYFKYQGKVSASPQSFEGRRDRYYFEKLSRKTDPRGFLLANMVRDPTVWIGALVQDNDSEVAYTKWLKRNQSLLYLFREDLNELLDTFDDNFIAGTNQHPYLLKLFLRNKISIESLTILVHLTKCFGRWNKLMADDPIWQDTARKISKYQPFMKYDLAKFKQAVLDKFSE